jgi:hypothetical protein
VGREDEKGCDRMLAPAAAPAPALALREKGTTVPQLGVWGEVLVAAVAALALCGRGCEDDWGGD